MSVELVVALLRAKADNHDTLASYWAIDPEEYGGTDELGVAEWRAEGKGLRRAADMVERYLGVSDEG